MRSVRKAISGFAFALLSPSVGAAPSIALVAPATEARYVAPAAIELVANPAVDAGRSIDRVEFLADGEVIGAATQPPYAFSWTNVARGNYNLRARIFDSAGAREVSPVVRVHVRNNTAPRVHLSAPGHRYLSPGAVPLTAQVTDRDDPIAKVEFFSGDTLLATATAEPYAFDWTNVAVGDYALTAKATDTLGAAGTSNVFRVRVRDNAAPHVRILVPGNNTTYPAPASIAISIRANDRDDNLTGVELFANGSPLTAFIDAPYEFSWANVPPGTYALTARATDDLGLITTSRTVNVTVTGAPPSAEPKLYFIHVDHLNTPRLVADEQQQSVWRWDQQEPFGTNLPDENPSGLGSFEMPLRLPGQHFDRDTNLSYNYFRDYDSAVGRYVESDPIGLEAGSNTYAYVIDNPLSYLDPFGLVNVCYYADAAAGFGHVGFGVGSETKTYGYYATGSITGSPGVIQEDAQKLKECKIVPSNADQDNCLLDCRARRRANPGWYNITTNQCTKFVRDCLTECGIIKGSSPSSAPRRLYLQLPGKSQ